MNIYFERVERVLSRYPVSWQKNYYQNKRDLIIKNEVGEIDSIFADYDHRENIITVYNGYKDSLSHELFHMAFRNKEKVEKQIQRGKIYGNGVSINNMEGKKYGLYGITEGFAEYLSRLEEITFKGHNLEYFFTDLFLFIYGEEIFYYPFHNDPIGFIMDDRFYCLNRFTCALDGIFSSSQEVLLMNYLKEEINHAIQKDEEMRLKVIECIGNNIENYNHSIEELFRSIIDEYYSYKNKKHIDKRVFVNKLSSFFSDPDYKIAFAFDGEDNDLRKTIYSLVKKL